MGHGALGEVMSLQGVSGEGRVRHDTGRVSSIGIWYASRSSARSIKSINRQRGSILKTMLKLTTACRVYTKIMSRRGLQFHNITAATKNANHMSHHRLSITGKLDFIRYLFLLLSIRKMRYVSLVCLPKTVHIQTDASHKGHTSTC